LVLGDQAFSDEQITQAASKGLHGEDPPHHVPQEENQTERRAFRRETAIADRR
jgi:hypothetical protein